MHGFQVITAQSMTHQRWDQARTPTPVELKQTALIRVVIDSATAKKREGPPHDDEADLALPIWSGLIPRRGTPLPDEYSVGSPPTWWPQLQEKL